MKKILVLASLGMATVAQADDAYLRLRCDGEAAGALVSINGAKKGECPVDLVVPEGKIRLSVRKSMSEHSFKLYEKELFLSAGAMKRESVVLGPLQFTAEGQRLENERIAREKAEAEAQAAALAEKRRLEEEEKAKYGITVQALDTLSSKDDAELGPFSWSTMATGIIIDLPLFTLSDVSSGKKVFRTAADPAAFAKPGSMVGRVQAAESLPES
ncbi:MAG TPA: hypothetical protein VF050_06645 [Moraxellaceae bacterium]